MKDKLVHLSMQVCIFLLRGAGWAAIGVFVGFVVSNFFRLPGRFDTFAFTETMLGVVITGLAIVGAFMVVLQWSNLESKMHVFDVKVKETHEFFDNANKRAEEVATNINEYIQSKVDYLENLLEENAKTADIINLRMVEYKKMYLENEESFMKRQNQFEEKERALEERQKEISEIVKEYGKLLDRFDKAVELRTGGKQSDIEEAATNGL